MKKIVFALIAVLLMLFAACSSTQIVNPQDSYSEPVDTTEPVTITDVIENTPIIEDEKAQEPLFELVIKAEEGFHNCGFTYFVAPVSGNYSFTASEDEDVTWRVFILDEEFQGANRFISQTRAAALDGDGYLEIEEGKYVYVQCSVHGFTTDQPNLTEYIEIVLE